MAQQPEAQLNAPQRPPGNYRELYSNGVFQAGEPMPKRLIASYRFNEVAGGGERPTPASLVEQTFAFSERCSLTFLCLSRVTGMQTEVRILHRVMWCLELPGDAGGDLIDMLGMGLLGDIRPTQIPAVAVDNTHFSLINAGVRVPTVATMSDHLAAAPPGVYLGPFAADVPGTELVRPRVTQVIPAKYAAALVHRDGVPPEVAYNEICGMLEADNMLAACADVVSWLRVACTARGGAGDLAPLPAVAHSFSLLLLPAAVGEYVASKVDNDLPGRSGNARTGASLVEAPMLEGMRQLATGAADDRATRAPKSVEEAYRETHMLLQRVCHVDSIEGLAPIWGRLARGSKIEAQSIIQQELTKVCAGRGLSPDIYCPAVTTSINQLVTGLNFAGHGPDDIAVGCQSYLVIYSGTEDHYRAMDAANVANQLDQGAANASLADIREIRSKERVKMPQDLNQVGYTLRRYAVLVHALFQGPGATNHPFVECFWILANTFNDRLPIHLSEHHKLRGTAWYDVYPAHIVRHVQINAYEYLQALQTSGGGVYPLLPSFAELHKCLQRDPFLRQRNGCHYRRR